MMQLHTLTNTSRPYKGRRRVGRGTSSGMGKTCGRGTKGSGSRAGYQRREGNEGGQFKLYMKLPVRGFCNAKFARRLDPINLWQLEKFYEDGDLVNIETLREKGLLKGETWGIKLLGDGELTKKVAIQVDAMSAGTRQKLDALGISYTLTVKAAE